MAGDVPAVFADQADETWRSEKLTSAWLRANGVPLTKVGKSLLSAGPATRLRTSVAAWKAHTGFASTWPHKYDRLTQKSLAERLSQIQN